MKLPFIIVMPFLLLIGCSADINAQCSKNCKGCKKKEIVQGMKQGTDKKQLSCKLTSPKLRKRKEGIISQLKKQVIERKELADGYSYKFTGTDEMLDTLTEFIKSERQCCDFFNFKLTVSNDSFIWIDITGEDGAKEFITTELEM